MGPDKVVAAGPKEVCLRGKVPVKRVPLHSGQLGDGGKARFRGANRAVELDRRFDDSLPGLTL